MASLLRKLFNRLVSDDASETSSENEQNKHQMKSDEKTLTTLLGPFEAYVVTAQSILIWEKPLASSLVLLFVNVIFWLAVSCNYRFYFVLAASLSFIHIYRTWTNQIWPEIRIARPDGEDTEEWTPVNPQVLSVPEISRHLGNLTESCKQCYHWLISTREKQPGMFCVLVTSSLTVLGLVGCYISGVFIAYLTIMTVMIGPGCLVHIYPHLLQFLNVVSNESEDRRDVDEGRLGNEEEEEDLDLEEFLPENNQETLEVLSKAGDALHTDDESVESSQELIFGLIANANQNDSEDGSLQNGLSEVPSYDNLDSDDEKDGTVSIHATSPPKPPHTGTEINFVPCYFDDDSEDDADDDDETTAKTNSEEDSRKLVEFESRSIEGRIELCDDEEEADDRDETDVTTIAKSSSVVPTVVKRQISSPSDGDSSDYEIVSESELS